MGEGEGASRETREDICKKNNPAEAKAAFTTVLACLLPPRLSAVQGSRRPTQSSRRQAPRRLQCRPDWGPSLCDPCTLRRGIPQRRSRPCPPLWLGERHGVTRRTRTALLTMPGATADAVAFTAKFNMCTVAFPFFSSFFFLFQTLLSSSSQPCSLPHNRPAQFFPPPVHLAEALQPLEVASVNCIAASRENVGRRKKRSGGGRGCKTRMRKDECCHATRGPWPFQISESSASVCSNSFLTAPCSAFSFSSASAGRSEERGKTGQIDVPRPRGTKEDAVAKRRGCKEQTFELLR